MKLYLAISCFFISTQIIATTTKNILKTLSESPIALEFELDNQLTRNDNNAVNGLGNTLAINFYYTIFNSQNLNLNSEISHRNTKKKKAQYNFNFIEFGYSKDLEINSLDTSLTSSLYYQYSADKETRAEEMQNGSTYFLITSESKISTTFLIEGEIQFTKFFNTSSENDVISSNFNIQINPTYNITDTLSLKFPINSSFEFNKGKNKAGYLNTTIAPTASYSFASGLTFEAYIEFAPINSYDGSLLSSNFEKEATYGTTLTYDIF